MWQTAATRPGTTMGCAERMDDTRQSEQLLGDWLCWDPGDLPPSPWNAEVPLLAWLTSTLRPSLCVELGAGDGDSFRALCQVTDRFGRSGRCVGIDTWLAPRDPQPPFTSPFEVLDDYCRTHHAQSASLLRTNVNAAVGEFEDESIDLLHVAQTSSGGADVAVDIGPWLRKVRRGGVVVVPSASEGSGDPQALKVWQEIASVHPAVVLRLRPSIGVAQVAPSSDEQLIEILSHDPRVTSAFFRLLGERTDLRHAVGSRAVSPEHLRRSFADLTSRHADEVRRLQGEHHAALETIKDELAATSTRLLTYAQETTALQAETDMLLARLASQTTRHDQEVSRLKERMEADTAQLRARHRAEIASLEHQLDQLQKQRDSDSVAIAQRDAEIAAIKNTVSWKVTWPLRVVQSARLNRARRRFAS